MSKYRMPPRLLAGTVGASVLLAAGSGWAFSQSSPVTPIGHEWITVESAHELLKEPVDAAALQAAAGASVEGEDAVVPSPMLLEQLEQREAKGPSLTPQERDALVKVKGTPSGSSYGTKHYAVWSAVMGQRWVDLGGFRVTAPHGKKCWDAITQAQDHVQYSHFLRQPTDRGAEGALRAIKAAQGRLKLSFIAAAMAKDGDITFWDGGAASTKMKASRPYFLFGRAVHLFEDSFSPEHGVRDDADGYRTVTGIKSYVCTPSSLLHTHAVPNSASHGDVIWKKVASFSSAKTNVKPIALAATQGTRDLWAAFLKARAAPEATRQKVAEEAIDGVIAQWMSYSEKGVREQASHAASNAELAACKFDSAKIETERKACVAEIGKASEQSDMDEDLQIPFDWGKAPKE